MSEEKDLSKMNTAELQAELDNVNRQMTDIAMISEKKKEEIEDCKRTIEGCTNKLESLADYASALEAKIKESGPGEGGETPANVEDPRDVPEA